jgi:hypothetical protein
MLTPEPLFMPAKKLKHSRTKKQAKFQKENYKSQK